MAATMNGEDTYQLPLTGPRSAHEELVNSLTHGAGFFVSVVASIVLVAAAVERGTVWTVLGCGIYSVTLMLVYLASTLSHLYQRPKAKRAWRILDQAFIYLLVAGSYTPWALEYLREGWPLLVLILMWGVALGGFVSKLFFAHRVDGVVTWIYLGLGWLPILAIGPILDNVPHAGLWWVAAGGACYTVGVIFLKLDNHVPFFHAVWHKLVIAGSACQWLGVYWYVVMSVA